MAAGELIQVERTNNNMADQESWITIRSSRIVLAQLQTLVKLLGENKSQVLKRAIAEMYERYVKPQGAPGGPS